MFIKIIMFTLFFNCLSAKHMMRHLELDDDEEQLLRSAYETPTYDHDHYEEQPYSEEYESPVPDLLKDGKWALKAKLKELKALDIALKANLVSNHLKLKDLLENHMDPIKKHHHKKPTYSYQAPAYQHYLPQYPQAQAAQAYQPYEQAPVQPQQFYEYNRHDPYYGH